jgi:nucleoside-diphosphate-sugar epimerase
MELFQMGDGDIAADYTADFSAPAGVRKIAWELPGPPPLSLGDVRYTVHLAGLSSVAHSHAGEQKVMDVNLEGTRSIASWIKERSPASRLLLASSAEVYKPSMGRMLETSLTGPRSPYGASKLAAEELLCFSGIDCITARSFPHFGPGQAGHFVLPSFCRRIIRAMKNGEDTISAGNLTAVRDYLYIDDVVCAYACLLARGHRGGIYNVCSGQGNSIGELLFMLMDISGSGLRTTTDPRLLREDDQFHQIGNPDKLIGLGWAFTVPLPEGLKMLYKWWEERL